MVGSKIVFLWLPKRINGKWCWLTRAIKTVTTQTMCIEGNVVPFKNTTYQLLKGDDTNVKRRK